VVIFGVGYMFFIRPRSQAARRQRDTLMELSAGDEVLTGAGIFGTVLDVESDRVTLETAPGTRITVLRSTIARRIPDATADAPSWDEHDEDEAHGAYHEYEHGHDEDEAAHEDGHDEAEAAHEDGHDEDEAAHEDGHDEAEAAHDDVAHDDASKPDTDDKKKKT
jgi:preprotein translocase subunit YajC